MKYNIQTNLLLLFYFPLSDVDECKRFQPEVCKNGVCVNNIPGYNCYCTSGYVYNSTLLECVGAYAYLCTIISSRYDSESLYMDPNRFASSHNNILHLTSCPH